MVHSAIAASAAAVPRNTVRRLPIDGGLLLLDEVRGLLFAYNATAAGIWDLLSAGGVAEDAVNWLVLRFQLPSPRAQEDVAAILQDWQGNGLIGAKSTLPQKVSTACPTQVALQADGVSWSCMIAGIPISFRVRDEQHASLLRPLFQHLEISEGDGGAFIELKRASDGTFVVTAGEAERLRSSSLAEALGGVHQSALEYTSPQSEWLALIHGGAVAWEQSAIIFAGPPGYGKSTLIAALSARGYRYLADDLAALATPSGALHPWPLAQSIKTGSISALEEFWPAITSGAQHGNGSKAAHLRVPPGDPWAIRPQPVRHVIFPQYVAGHRGELSPLTTFAAFERLIRDRIWLGYPITEARVTRFLDWLRITPCHALTYGDLRQAVGRIDELVQ